MAPDRGVHGRAEKFKAIAHASRGEINASAATLVKTLDQTADALEHTAALAEQEALRRATADRDDVDEEREAAAQAREAAQRARAHADEWRRYLRARSG